MSLTLGDWAMVATGLISTFCCLAQGARVRVRARALSLLMGAAMLAAVLSDHDPRVLLMGTAGILLMSLVQTVGPSTPEDTAGNLHRSIGSILMVAVLLGHGAPHSSMPHGGHSHPQPMSALTLLLWLGIAHYLVWSILVLVIRKSPDSHKKRATSEKLTMAAGLLVMTIA